MSLALQLDQEPSCPLAFLAPSTHMTRKLLTGQYPPETYTHSSSSVERGRDNWQENHYLRYGDPASPGEEQQGQAFPSTSDQMFQQFSQEEPAYGKPMD